MLHKRFVENKNKNRLDAKYEDEGLAKLLESNLIWNNIFGESMPSTLIPQRLEHL